MKTKIYICLFFLLVISQSCNSYRYIHDSDSLKRQKEIVSGRSVNRGCDAAGCFSSALLTAILGIEFDYLPSQREFKNLNIINPTADTMFVNMLTDATWNNEEYCDFNDVRIPPGKKWRVLVPIGINYNLYFGITDNPENDEKLEINTSEIGKIILTPGLTNSEKPID